MSVAVVIPSHGRPGPLARCLEALARQEGGPCPVVVVDDGSPEPLAPVCARFPFVRCIRQENAGPAAARNRGARESGADVLAFTDDDCLPRPGWVRALLAAQGGDAARLVGGRVVNAFPGSLCAEASQSLADWIAGWQAARGGIQYFTSNNLGCARAGFEAVGGFDERYPMAAGEDRDFGLRWRERQGPLVAAPDAVVDHAHVLDLRRYWRQHMTYGRGARHVHTGAEGEGRGLLGPGFYAGLVLHPLRDGARPLGRRLALTALMGVAQAATAAGYLAEGRRRRGGVR